MTHNLDIAGLLADMNSCPSAHFLNAAAIRTQYRNDAKVSDLFQSFSTGIIEIAELTKNTREATIKGNATVGISTAVIQFILNLKASLEGGIRLGESIETVVRTNPIADSAGKLALAETILRQQDLIQHDPESNAVSKPYVRFIDRFRPFWTDSDDDLRKQLSGFVGRLPADAIVRRKHLDEVGHPGTKQFVYASAPPITWAAIAIVPPQEALKISGDTWACYPQSPGWNRVFFGVPADELDGVRFLNLYYVIDAFPERGP